MAGSAVLLLLTISLVGADNPGMVIDPNQMIDRTELGAVLVSLPDSGSLITQIYRQEVILDLSSLRPTDSKLPLVDLCTAEAVAKYQVTREQCVEISGLNTQSHKMYLMETNLFDNIISRANHSFPSTPVSRSVRGLWEGILHTVDISSYSDLKELKRKIQGIHSSQQKISKLIVNGNSLLTKITNDLHVEITSIHAQLKKAISELEHNVEASWERERWLRHITSQLNQYQAKIMHQRLERVATLTQMEIGVLNLARSKFTAEIIKPAELERIIYVVNCKLSQQRMNYEVLKMPIGKLYDRIQPHTTIQEDQLTITLDIPISHNLTKYNVYKVISLPFTPSQAQLAILGSTKFNHLRLKMDFQYLFIQPATLEYIVLSDTQYLTCRQAPELCNLGITLTSEVDSCIINIYRNNIQQALKVCDFETVTHHTHSLTFLTEKVVYLHDNVTLQSACRTVHGAIQTHLYHLDKPAIVGLSCLCSYKISNVSVPYRLSHCMQDFKTQPIHSHVPEYVFEQLPTKLILPHFNYTNTSVNLNDNLYRKLAEKTTRDLRLLRENENKTRQISQPFFLSNDHIGHFGTTVLNYSTIISLVISTISLLVALLMYCEVSKLQTLITLLSITKPVSSMRPVVHSMRTQYYFQTAEIQEAIDALDGKIGQIREMLLFTCMLLSLVIVIQCTRMLRQRCSHVQDKYGYQIVLRIGNSVRHVNLTVLRIPNCANPHPTVVQSQLSKDSARTVAWNISRSGISAYLHLGWDGRDAIKINVESSLKLAWPTKVKITLANYWLLQKLMLSQTNVSCGVYMRCNDVIYLHKPSARPIEISADTGENSRRNC